MKNRFKILFSSLLAVLSISIFSCNSVHIHQYEWKYDEDNHWQECVHCGERIGVTSHKMNSINDTCIVCGYKDQVAIKNEDGVMTGLTKYAKKKEKVTIPADIKYLGQSSFQGSDATSVDIDKSLIGIYDNAFEGSNKMSQMTPKEISEHISSSEGAVKWMKIGDVYYKYNESEDKEAIVDGKFYSTLKEAIESVKEDDVTVTLLTPTIKSSTPIEVNFNINLEANAGITCTLPDTEFIIKPGAYLRIAESVKYEKGLVKLLLGEVREKIGNKEVTGYSSGSLIFLKKDEEPNFDNFKVEYVKSIDDEEPMYANGSKNSELLTPCFAYGLFKVDKDMNNLIGLTEYGASLNKLTVNNPIKNKIFNVSEWAFTTPTEIRIKIPLKDIKIDINLQKGSYRHLIIGDGIRNIGYRAFSNWHDKSQIPAELISSLAPIVAPLTTLQFDSSTLENIGEAAFYFCAGLTTVSSTSRNTSLKTMGVAVFQECFNLKNVDLSGCIALERVAKHAFLGDTALIKLTLACDVGWQFSLGFGYRPEDMRDPGIAAFLAVHAVYEQEWVRNINAKFCYYNPKAKDKDGRYSHVFYANDFQSAYNNSNDDYVISACDKDAKIDDTITINKSLHLDVCKNYEGAKLNKVNVNPGKYLIVNDKLVGNNTEFYLKADGGGDDFKNVPGVAIERSENSIPSNGYNVWIANNNSGTVTVSKEIRIAKLNDGKYYDAYGIVNFKLNPNERTEKFNSLATLGKMATEFELAPQIYDGYIELADNLFAGNDNIRKVTFSDIKNFPRHALANNISNTIEEAVFKNVWNFDYRSFYACKKLNSINFSDNKNLKSIGEKAFGECPNLKEVTLPNDCDLKKIGKEAFVNCQLIKFDFANIASKWKAGNHEFNDTELTPTVAAKYLINDYKSVEWNRKV